MRTPVSIRLRRLIDRLPHTIWAGDGLPNWTDQVEKKNMISVNYFEEFWLARPFLEKALLDVIDIPLFETTITLDGAEIEITWVEIAGGTRVGVEINHPEFYIVYETDFDQAQVEGDKFRVILNEDDRFDMLRDFDGPKDTDAFQPFFHWLAKNTAHSSYLAKIKAAAAVMAEKYKTEAAAFAALDF
jgi:hypothetical protein